MIFALIISQAIMLPVFMRKRSKSVTVFMMDSIPAKLISVLLFPEIECGVHCACVWLCVCVCLPPPQIENP